MKSGVRLRLTSVLVLSLLACLFLWTVGRQLAIRPGKSRSAAAVAPAQKGEERDRVLQAIDFLASLAEKVSVPEIRVASYAEIGELLWPVDAARARQYFRLAFQAIEQAQTEAEERSRLWRSGAAEEDLDRRRQKMRAKLLEVVTGLDSELAEEISRAGSRSRMPLEQPSTVAANVDEKRGSADARKKLDESVSGEANPLDQEPLDLRLVQADELLPKDPRQAAVIAAEAMERQITIQAVNFLLTLRRYDRVAADTLFSTTVERMAVKNPPDVLGLAALGLYLNVQDSSGAVSAELARQYVGALSAALTRAAALSAGLSATERQKGAAAYLLATGFVSSFSRYGADVAQTLQTALAQAGAQLAPTGGSPPAVPSGGTLGALSARLPESELMRAVDHALAKKDFARARQLIDQIGDASVRELKLAQFHQAASHAALEAGDIEQARKEALAISGKYERVRLLAEIAGELVERKELPSAAALLNEARSYIESQSPSVDKAQALIALTQTMIAADPAQAFALATALVTTLNRVWAAFPSDYQAYRALEDTQGQSESLFTALGRVDFDQALALAHQLDNLNLRVPMGVAVCKGAWERLAAETRKAESEVQPGSTEAPSGQKKKRSANESPPGSSPVVRPPAAPPRK